MDSSSLQHLIEQLQQKKAQAEASLVNLKMETAVNLAAYYNDILYKLNFLANSGANIPDPVSYIREEIAKATLISQAFNLQAIFPFIGENGCSPPVNNQEMSGGVLNAVECNARQLAQQPSGCSTGNSKTNDSPSNAAQSINLSQFNSHSNLDNQSNMEIVNDDDEQIDHVVAEDDGNAITKGNLEEDKSIDNIETEGNNHYDRQEGDNEVAMIVEEAADGGDSDHFKKQVSMSGVEDNDDAQEEPTAGPSTSNGHLSKPEALSVITKKYKCPVTGCKKAVKNKIALNRHFLSAHKVKKYRCMVRRCYGRVSTSFTTKPQFEDHLQQVHGRTTRWACHCSMKFDSHTELNFHFRNDHERGQFACSKDGCTFKPASTRSKVLHHQASHPGVRYACPVGGCDKSFKTTSHLDRHLFTHSGERPLDCPECDMSFYQNHHLTRHLLTHSEERSFACPKCDMSFTQKSNLKTHRLTHAEDRSFVCPECDMAFKRKDHLTTHLLTHSEERPFDFPECDTAFKRKAHLTDHLRIHRNDKCFRCTWPQCVYSSTQRGPVLEHIRSVHFKLPATKKQQTEENIEDDRDPRDYLAKD